MRNAGPSPKAVPCTTATPSASSSSVTKSSSLTSFLPVERGLADGAGAGRIDVEGAFRRRAVDAVGLVEHRHHEVAPLLEDLVVLGDEVLRPVQRLDRRPLRDRRRVGGRLRLDHRHRLDQRLRPAGIADAPAGHAIGLGAAVDGERARIKLRLDLRRRRELEVVVDQVLVHVVGHDMHMRVLQQHVGQRLQLGARIGGAGRVRRRVEDQPFGLRRDRLFQRRAASA